MGESEIMRDNETEGGVVPENTKWVGGRGREKAGENRERIVERERGEGICIMIYYIIAHEVWHKWHGVLNLFSHDDAKGTAR